MIIDVRNQRDLNRTSLALAASSGGVVVNGIISGGVTSSRHVILVVVVVVVVVTVTAVDLRLFILRQIIQTDTLSHGIHNHSDTEQHNLAATAVDGG